MVKEYEFVQKVISGRRITLPKEFQVKEGDVVIVKTVLNVDGTVAHLVVFKTEVTKK
jgi:bifunctional DNA-binding transcriptional regulator/antitoxin component of YhaV-PrlF toxin-antitoxin module